MSKKLFNLLTILASLVTITIGIFFIIDYEKLWLMIRFFSLIVLGIASLNYLQNIILRQHNILHYSLITLFFFFLFLIILLNNSLFHSFITIFYILLSLGLTFGFLVTYYVFRQDQQPWSGFIFLEALISFCFAIILIINYEKNLFSLALIWGIYLIIFGFSRLLESLNVLLNQHHQWRFSISLPIFFSSLSTISYYHDYQRLIKHHHLTPLTKPKASNQLIISIYLNNQGFDRLGHVDLSFKGKTYSYGCHDKKSRKLNGSLGDGVLFVCDYQKYLTMALNEGRMAITYTYQLGKKEEEIIQERIDQLLKRATPWYPLGYTDPNCNDYASRVYRHTAANFYKFNYGRFKTYFVFSTNCVLLSDEILKSPQLNLINLNGVITPGAYINFLNHEFYTNQTIVERNIYYKQPNKK